MKLDLKKRTAPYARRFFFQNLNMPKKSIKFIPEYLIPSLNSKRFGEHLKWVDKSKNVFQIDWRHKAGPKWTEEEAEVFVEWDKHKGRFKPEDKHYYTQSKQRFRALLYKLTKSGHLIELECDTKFKKIYCIGEERKRRRKTDLSPEYESYNEEETSEELGYSTDDIFCRKISEDHSVNVLEDHSYSIREVLHNLTDFLPSDAENTQIILSNNQDTYVHTLSTDSLSDNLHKRILAERNSENLTALGPVVMPNYFTESFSLPENIWDGLQNASLPCTTPAGKLLVESHLPNENALLNVQTFANDNSLSSLNMELLYKTLFDGN